MAMPRVNAAIRRQRARRPGSASGFTYLEVIVVVLVMTILGAVAGLRYAKALAFQRVQQSARRIAADLELAGATARLTSRTVTVTFNLSNHSYTLANVPNLERAAGSYVVPLAEGNMACNLTSAQFGADSVVSFNGHGVPDSGGQVVVASGGQTATVTLTAGTGRVSRP